MPPRMVKWLARLARFLCSRTGAALVVLLLFALTALAILLRREPEPSYQNIPASAWLELVATNSQETLKTVTAFREMGPAGAEYLGDELLRKPSQFHEWLLARHQQIPAPFKPFLLKPQRQKSRADTILELLSGLGTNAAPAIPQLITWLDQNGPVLTTSAPLPTNGFSIATNSTVLGFGIGFPSRGQKTGGPTVLAVPAKSIITLQTQSVVSAPGLVTTNVTVTVKSATPTLPRIAFQILTNLGSEDPRVIPLLLNPVVNFNYIRPPTFGTNLKTAASQSVPLLVQSLNTTERNRKFTALALLSLALPESQPAREAMINCLKQNDYDLIDSAVRSLINSTNDLDRIVPLLIDALSRFQTRRGLFYYYNLDQSEIYPALETFARHSPLVIPQLQTALSSLPYQQQQNILKLLGQIGTTNTLDMALIKSFTIHKEATVQAQAWFTLGRLTGDVQAEVKGHLALMEKGTDQTVWKSYLRLGELGPEARIAVPMLRRFLLHQDERMIAKAAENLAKIGPAAKDALPDLEALRTHPHLMVREPVEDAIRKITAPPKAKGAE